MYTKPLYEAEKEIEYQKHLERLKKINRKKIRSPQSRNTIEEMHKIRHQSSDFKWRQKNNHLNLENNKILNKIIEIAERKEVPQYSTVTSHQVPPYKNRSVIIFDNPERKKRQHKIMEENSQLAKKLLTKESEFDRSKTMKTIEEYENIKKLLHNNKRIRLVPVLRGEGVYDFSRVSTEQQSRERESRKNTIFLDSPPNEASI